MSQNIHYTTHELNEDWVISDNDIPIGKTCKDSTKLVKEVKTEQN